jgi:chromate transporter
MAAGTPSRLGELFRFFLRLGLTAFGGPAAHIALMEREAVERRAWLKREEFLDLVGACNLLPGPGSTQVALALGYRQCGWLGLLAAGVCFIGPASLITLALAVAYVRFGTLPQAQGLLYGAKPVMVAIVAGAIFRLARTALRTWQLALLGALALAAASIGAPPIAILLLAGAVRVAAAGAWKPAWKSNQANSLGVVALACAAGPATASLASILLVFLKLGVVVFGSGYVLLAFLQRDLVERLHWVTQTQLLDAVTAGQITPGPLFATATFLGFVIHGYTGAAVATAGIFLPSFAMAAAVGALAPRLRASPVAAAFLDGVNAAAVALMTVVALELGRAALVDAWTVAIALASAALLIRWRVNATWLILGGAALGILLHAIRL